MTANYKKMIALTSLITASPMLVGIYLWDKLPARMATHFQTNNQADGFSSKPMAVFGIPLILLAAHLICAYVTLNDPKKKNIYRKSFVVLLWLFPINSWFVAWSVYGTALNRPMDISRLSYLMIGAIFIALGNYLPKTKQNYTVGIKTPWSLHSAENWNRTNRVGGWILVVVGIAMLAEVFVQTGYMMYVSLLLLFIPVGYSFLLYKKGI